MPKILENKIADLFPGYFSMVMATGVLSIAVYLFNVPLIPILLLYLNLIFYMFLWLLTIMRFIKFFRNVVSDITNHARGPGFFTFVAGTCVLGGQFVLIAQRYDLAMLLWYFGISLWFLIMYVFFSAIIVRADKPSLTTGINGSWLIAAVATQSISILGTLLSRSMMGDIAVTAVLFFTLCMFLLGCMLYLTMICLIFYRFTFLILNYSEFTPSYWINMGAMAITTLAGSTLILNAHDSPFLSELLPFIKGFTLFFWITGTWWIPILLILMIWRHVYHRQPLTYDPQLWGMVFPLAMYTTGTFQLSRALQLPFLLHIPRVVGFVAVIAWLAVLSGFVLNMYRIIRRWLSP